jgi:hypothetical protein
MDHTNNQTEVTANEARPEFEVESLNDIEHDQVGGGIGDTILCKGP